MGSGCILQSFSQMPIQPHRKGRVLLIACAMILNLWMSGCATRWPMPPDIGESLISAKDSRWSNHGKYLTQFLKTIQAQWYAILAESRLAPRRGSGADVTFTINSKGETDIVKVSNADCGKLGVMACENAVIYSQPYPKWSGQMIADIGDSQTITVSFQYQ
jgi:hypothetical protein